MDLSHLKLFLEMIKQTMFLANFSPTFNDL